LQRPPAGELLHSAKEGAPMDYSSLPRYPPHDEAGPSQSERFREAAAAERGRSAEGASMAILRRIAVWVLAVYWVGCLAVHVVVAVTRSWPLPGYYYAYWILLTGGLAVAVTNITKPAGSGVKDPAPRWYIPALGVAAMICMLWPWVVGSGVPNAPSGLRWVFEETGVPGGPPGDRSLDSHGRRVRAITEEEFQRVEAWQAVMWTGGMAGFSGMTLAMVFYFQQVRRTPNHPLV
jgi:hypothetical protein